MRKRIEERAQSQGNRLARTPFVLSVAYLYYALCAPVYLTAASLTAIAPPVIRLVQKTLVGITWFGFLLAAVGDFTKTALKLKEGETHLVTSGVFRFFRHPNYTGEVIGWSSSALAGILAFCFVSKSGQQWFELASTVIGAAGIDFVLMAATRNLERRQKESYGDQEEYSAWLKRSWIGFALPETAQNSEGHVKPKIELEDKKEQSGSGI